MLFYNDLKNKKFIMCGPNVIESHEHTFKMASELKKIFSKYDIIFIFKSSFDKANRSSLNSYRGLGIEEGLKVLKRIKDELKIPIITDIHENWQAEKVKDIVDIIQIPAFLCRQTDLLKAAAETGKIIHVKKGQMCSAEQMHKCKEKIIAFGNTNVILCERGNSFGYQDLVVDPRNLIWLKSDSNLVSMDITHCLQTPSQKTVDGIVKCGGYRELIPYMGKIAITLGVNGIFMEVHDNPDKALCDGPTQWHLDKLEWLLDFLLIKKNYKPQINYSIINKKKNIDAFICIRFNNTRLPNKNILNLNNKPLCYWIFDKLQYVNGLNNIYVYCSDKKIMNYIPKNIKFIKRDKKYDGNEILANELLKSFTEIVKSDYYLLCHATCPFLKVSTIQSLIDKFNINIDKYDSAFTCKKYKTFLWDKKNPLNFKLDNIPRTQDMDPFYIENVGAYLYSYNEIIKNNRRIGKNPLLINVSDIECVDIDNEEDYLYAKKIENLLEETYE